MGLIEFDDVSNAKILVIGVGGGGGNAVNTMINGNLDGVEFVAANTDMQALEANMAPHKLQLGSALTRGLGAGANPDVGRRAAEESMQQIADLISGADMVFITAGMGGGTGTGAAPVVAQLAKEMGILTVAVVTKPFPFEGRRRMQVALKGIEELSQHCDSLITIPNEKLITVLGRNATMIQAFRAANDVLLGAVQGIADLIVRPGLINVDFADVRTVMSEMGLAMMGTGSARGDDRAQAAAESAIQNPLLDDVNLTGANGILVNITAGPDFTMAEFDEVGRTVEQFASEDATVVIGTVLDPDMQDEVRVTVVATGLNRASGRATAGRDRTEARFETGYDAPRRPQVQLINTQGKRDGTTGLMIDEVADPFVPNPSIGIAGSLRRGAESAPAVAELPKDDYLDIPAFLRRQAD
jgi:cell division protein FtsZ